MSHNAVRAKCRYGDFGGAFMPEILMRALKELEECFFRMKDDASFKKEIQGLLHNYAGRPTPCTEISKFRKIANGPRVFIKREDLLHTGAHKINNALGQCLLAKKMGKKRVIAETGAGQHGVATATACAHLDLNCTIFMGANDIARQQPNVEKIKLLGAEVVSVTTGAKTLKDAVNAALREYATHFQTTHYCLGSALGPYPYPQMVAYFQEIIGNEAKSQCHAIFGAHPDIVIACVGGGSNAIGIFAPFLTEKSIRLIGIEAGGRGARLRENAARFRNGKPGILHGCYSYVLQDTNGQIVDTHSISAGLDYPMVGPQHADLFVRRRAEYHSVTDDQALKAFKAFSQSEGIIPALESSHALAFYMQEAHNFPSESTVLINLSGRGDKDLPFLIERGLL